MPDTLRTRIAAVLYNRVPYAQLSFDKASDEVRAEWLADADAVIRELALRRDERDGRIIYNGFGQPINVIKPKYRYVTEWTADD